MWGKAPDVGVFKYMDVSTWHITKSDAKCLQRDKKCGQVIVISKYPEGFFISVSDAVMDFGDLSKSFEAAFIKAFKAGCYILRLDCDGIEHDDLQKNEW